VQKGKIGHYGVSHLPAERIAAYLETGRVFAVMMELSAVTVSPATLLLVVVLTAGVVALTPLVNFGSVRQVSIPNTLRVME
jgi:aryl-alcohol dehydrogenase-like predicted oxidoreductase